MFGSKHGRDLADHAEGIAQLTAKYFLQTLGLIARLGEVHHYDYRY